jgi:hypothetical protein
MGHLGDSESGMSAARAAQLQKEANDAQDLEEMYEKKAQKEAELLQREADERQRLLDKEEAERMRFEERLHAERERLAQKEADANFKRALKNIQAEAKANYEAQTDAQARLSIARGKVAEAWGWYRDKESLQARLDEEKANAEAERQYEKDFAKLRGRRDWRTAKNLSLDQEAVRRVAFAREEEKAAQASLNAIAENTAATNEMLEQLLTMKEG